MAEETTRLGESHPEGSLGSPARIRRRLFSPRPSTKLHRHVDTKAELETKLAEIPEFATTIDSKLGTILVKEPEKAAHEYTDICVMGPNGLTKLLKYPKKARDVMRLALFLSPSPLNVAFGSRLKNYEAALESGATDAAVVIARNIVVDERAELNCRNPPCEHYSRNLMCPPFTPSAKQCRKYLKRYKHGILIEVEEIIPTKMRNYIEQGWRLPRLRKNGTFRKLYDPLRIN
ncbi:MAG: DUF2284 domain-containing protein [Candidatus Bathyarchaeia archaeon]